MTSRLSGHFSIFGLVFFVLKSLLGIARQWSCDKFAILSLKSRISIFFISEQFCVPGNSIVLSPELYITVLAYTSILNPEVPQVCVKSVGTGTFY